MRYICSFSRSFYHTPAKTQAIYNSLVLGAMPGGIIVFVLEWLPADKLPPPQSVERYLGLPVLGAIPPAAEH